MIKVILIRQFLDCDKIDLRPKFIQKFTFNIAYTRKISSEKRTKSEIFGQCLNLMCMNSYAANVVIITVVVYTIANSLEL